MQISKKSYFIVLLCFLINFLMLFPSSLATATGDGQFTKILPTDSMSEFEIPNDVAIDKDGNVYVADMGLQLIQKFSADGTVLDEWGGSYSDEEGEFKDPSGIAVDADGNVYVADTNNHRIQKIAADGTVKVWGSSDNEFNNPSGIAVDAKGNVYVVEAGNHRIQKFDANGESQNEWGGFGDAEGQFKYPQGIAVDADGNVYVADTNNHRIQKIAADGTVKVWGSLDSGLNNPFGIAVDADGHVYVADTNNHRIQKLRQFNNVELNSLTVSSGMLSPSFPTTADTFTLNVEHAISSISITAATKDSLAKITLPGIPPATGTVTGTVSLTVGRNDIPITVTSEDGVTTKTYTITVTRAGSSDTTLNSLTVSEGTLSPAFAPHIDTYTVSVEQAVTSVHITASPTDPNASVQINGNTTTADTITLLVGQPTSIPIVVTAQDGGQKTYTVTVSPIPVTATGFTISPKTTSLKVGDKQVFTAVEQFSNNSTQDRTTNTTFTVSDSAIATMQGNILTAIAPGTVTVTATYGSTYDTATITVANREVPPKEESRPSPSLDEIKAIVEVIRENSEVIHRANITLDNVQTIVPKFGSQNERMARVVFPSDATRIESTLTRSAAEFLANNQTDLFIQTPFSDICIEHRVLNVVTNDVFFRIVPVQQEKQEAIQLNVAKNPQVQAFMSKHRAKNVKILGTPVTIETNLQNQPVTITLPIPKEATEEQIKTLVMHIKHSDGSTEVKRVNIIIKSESGVKGASFDVEHFSTFTLLYPSDVQPDEGETKTVAPYIQGYPDGTFKPNAFVTRAQMATMLARFLTNGDIPQVEATFADTRNSDAKDAIEFVKQTGLFNGKTATTFDPNGTITRAQMASVVVRWIEQHCTEDATKEYCTPETKDKTFTDVPANHWAAQAIEKVNALGIMTGNSATTFNPNGALTRAQAVKVLNQLFERPALQEITTTTFKDVLLKHWAIREIEAAATEMIIKK